MPWLPTLAAHISKSSVSAPLPGAATKRHVWAGSRPGLPRRSVTTCSQSAARSSWLKLTFSRSFASMPSHLQACIPRLAWQHGVLNSFQRSL